MSPVPYAGGGLKRIFDLIMGAIGLLLALPVILLCAAVVFLADRHNPFYISHRIGKDGVPFRLFKIRTMVTGASASGVDTTAANDPRLLWAGKFIRAAKFDELPQLFNVVGGDMSFVGPRPNVEREVARYTTVERVLLSVRPGITDFASIVFSDLATAIPGSTDANLAYNQYIRPWKSRLGLHYVGHASLKVDLQLLFFTFSNYLDRRWTLARTSSLLEGTRAAADLCAIALRDCALTPAAPPGADRVVTAEDLYHRSA